MTSKKTHPTLHKSILRSQKPSVSKHSGARYQRVEMYSVYGCLENTLLHDPKSASFSWLSYTTNHCHSYNTNCHDGHVHMCVYMCVLHSMYVCMYKHYSNNHQSMRTSLGSLAQFHCFLLRRSNFSLVFAIYIYIYTNTWYHPKVTTRQSQPAVSPIDCNKKKVLQDGAESYIGHEVTFNYQTFRIPQPYT